MRGGIKNDLIFEGGGAKGAAFVGGMDEVCRLPAKGYGTTEFDMSQRRLNALVEVGRRAMRACFEANP